MNKNQTFKKTAFMLFVALIALACNGGTLAATATSLPPIPPTFVDTPTARPTATPAPTATEIPPTLTPALKGESVTNGEIEVTVLDVFRHDRIVPGGTYYYTPNPGYIIINLFVKIKNLKADPVYIKWGDVYVIEGDKSWFPAFAGWKTVDDKEAVAPLSINYTEIDQYGQIVLGDTAYLQAIYLIGDKPEQTILFGIGNSPLIQLKIKK